MKRIAIIVTVGAVIAIWVVRSSAPAPEQAKSEAHQLAARDALSAIQRCDDLHRQPGIRFNDCIDEAKDALDFSKNRATNSSESNMDIALFNYLIEVQRAALDWQYPDQVSEAERERKLADLFNARMLATQAVY